MLKFNENHIFGNYIKQLLKEFNLPHYNNGNWANNLPNYNYNQKIKNVTRNLKIDSNIYDSHTHEYLGEYLRFYRDYNKINLMPLYNCFSNNICSSLSLDLKISKTKNIHISSNDMTHKIYMTPIKFDKQYTIAIDSNLPVEMWCAIYDKYQIDELKEYANNKIINNKTIDLASLTYKIYNNLQFNNPILFEASLIENLVNDTRFEMVTQNMPASVEERKKIVKKILNKYEDNLKLFIRLPINNDSSITILEGNYLAFNNSIYTNKIFNYSDPNLANKMTLLTTEPADWKKEYNTKYYQQNETSYEYIPKYTDLTFENKEWTKTLKFNGEDVWYDGDNIYYSTRQNDLENYQFNKSTNKWEPISWQGQNNFDGSGIWTDGDNIYYSYIYVLNKNTSTWELVQFEGLTQFNYDYIWTDGDNVYYSDDGEEAQYILDKATRTWTEITWNIEINGACIWTDGNNIYYSDDTNQYMLNKSTSTWESISWNIDFYGTSIWTDGNNIYLSSHTMQYVLTDSINRIWTPKTWEGFQPIYSNFIWTDGTNTYYSQQDKQYILDKTYSRWSEITWTVLVQFDGKKIWTYNNAYYYSVTHKTNYILNTKQLTWTEKTWDIYADSLNGSFIWKDKNTDNIYYSFGQSQYVLDKNLMVWKPIIWKGLTSFIGSDVWTDDKYIYYSNGDAQYILDSYSNTWIPKQWHTSFSYPLRIRGSAVWTDGDNIYFSFADDQWVLDKSTNTWSAMHWNGSFTNFDGENIWTDGEDYYYCLGSNQYILDKINKSWIIKSWNISFKGQEVWTDGDNIYYSNYHDQYQLNKNTSTWDTITWNVKFYGSNVWIDEDEKTIYLSNTNNSYILQNNSWQKITWNGGKADEIDGEYIWHLDNKVYYSYFNTQLELQGNAWIEKKWNGLTSFNGEHIWEDLDHNIYYSYGSTQYIFNKITSTWETKNWNISFYGSDIWTDDENIYYSWASDQYVLDKNTGTWIRKSWSGMGSNYFFGDCIWKDSDNNIYYSRQDKQCILDKTNNKWVNKTWNNNIQLGSAIWAIKSNIYYLNNGEGYYLKNYPTFEQNKYFTIDIAISTELYNKYQNQSIINIKNINKYPDDFTYITSLQLLRGNTHTSYPFADRLIEYLVGNTITSQEEISDNILRIQAVLAENNVQFKPYEKGIWQNKFRPYLYNKMYSSTKLNSFIDNHDILGYVDKETEKYYDYDPDHDEKTKNSISIAKVDIYPNIYKDSKK